MQHTFADVIAAHLSNLPKRPTAPYLKAERALFTKVLAAVQAGTVPADPAVKKAVLKYISQIELGADHSKQALAKCARYRKECGL